MLDLAVELDTVLEVGAKGWSTATAAVVLSIAVLLDWPLLPLLVDEVGVTVDCAILWGVRAPSLRVRALACLLLSVERYMMS